MRTVFNPDLKAYLSLDDADRVRSITHFQEYWASDEKTPLRAAIRYLHRVASVLSVPEVQLKNLHQRVSFLTPLEQGIEYRLSEEKHQFDSTTLSFYQTYLNVPVWQAGFTVTVKHGPHRIISAVNTSQEGFDAKLPAPKLIDRYKKLFTQAELENQRRRLEAIEEKEESKTADFVRELIDMGELKKSSQAARTDHARLIRGRFYVYKFDAHKRLPAQPSQTVAFSPTEKEPILPLPPVPETIRHGQYYIVAEVTFSFTTKEYGRLNWLALLEIETGAVLYLRALVGNVNGMVFVYDPITTTGDATHTPDQTNAVLNPHRTSELLLHLDAPVAGVQSLRGTYANVTNVENPNIAPPTEPAGTDFEDNVRTNYFAAVNAYYHVDRFFNLVESLGFPIGTYFNNTTFPIPVDHRGLGTAINAHCVGNGTGGIGHLCYALADSNTTDPLGIACDWGVHLHELGAHGILYEHIGTANLGFTHGPGDAIGAIAIDPESQAPDRFSFTHWVDIRRFDRENLAAGWAWGGIMDDKSYKSGEILATTLFRVYRSIGGDSTDLARRQFASRMMLYLILRAVQNLTPATNPSNVLGFANELVAVDLLNWTSEGVYGGAYNKVIRWSFERQGLYQAPGAPTPVTTAGQPPECDVYIEDGRGGEYPYQDVHWGNTSIWNRRNLDGGTTHEEPALGATNYAYVKIKNRGTLTANNVKVRGYHCKPTAGVVWPNDFQAFTTAELPAPGGGTLLGNNAEEKIVGPFEWTPVENAWGHDCMLMIVSADGDPSNVDNFTLGEFVQDWRLVPNDNNVGQRNVTLAPGGGGLKALMQALHGYSFWVGNPSLETATMELRVQLPEVLAANGWRLSFKGLPNNQFELRSGKQREIVMELRPGKDFDKNQVEKTTNRDIQIFVYADDALIGGMTYRLDPALTAAYNVARKAECLGKAQELLECLNISGQKVKKVHVQKVTLDIKTRDDDCDP